MNYLKYLEFVRKGIARSRWVLMAGVAWMDANEIHGRLLWKKPRVAQQTVEAYFQVLGPAH
jgi:hypothetical protein